ERQWRGLTIADVEHYGPASALDLDAADGVIVDRCGGIRRQLQHHTSPARLEHVPGTHPAIAVIGMPLARCVDGEAHAAACKLECAFAQAARIRNHRKAGRAV